MTDIPTPTVQAFLVCDQVIEDSFTKKKSLIGIFTHLQTAAFPFQHQQMGLYFCLTDAEGLYHFDIELIYLNSEQLICRAALPNIEISDRLQISDFGINIPLLIFPAPGRYEWASHRSKGLPCHAGVRPLYPRTFCLAVPPFLPSARLW